ncbi:MAG: methyltransferase domain-containing protein [Clostridiales bacterium]|nr:methyltransferase domain-containing protein [Clostridiales bacterium]
MVQLGEYEQLEDMQIDGLQIVQDTRLYRFTSDSVLLTRFARAKNGDNVADFCAGSGVVAFHFYALNRKKYKNLQFTLFELQPALSELSKKTADVNGFTNFAFQCGRLQEFPNELRESFSLVLCNPPYERGGLENDEYEKAICRKEITVNLKEIALAAAKALKYGGRIAILNRADRVAELCYTFREVGIEIKRLQFVAGKAGAKPYLVMAEGVKGGKPSCDIMPMLINEKGKEV